MVFKKIFSFNPYQTNQKQCLHPKQIFFLIWQEYSNSTQLSKREYTMYIPFTNIIKDKNCKIIFNKAYHKHEVTKNKSFS